MDLLGQDGMGFELARWLEACGTWRTWLGNSSYANFVRHLSSPSSWEAFMRPNNSESTSHLHLQFRVRALLYDKACVSLFLPKNIYSSSGPEQYLSNLNPNYLQLHGDDVYFTLENIRGCPSKEIPNNAKRSNEKLEMENISQMHKQEDIGDSWYTKFNENHHARSPYVLSSADMEMNKRSSEEMSAFIRCSEKHKRKRAAFILGNKPNSHSSESSILMSNFSVEDDAHLFPETMFTLNCVPESALAPSKHKEYNREKIETLGVFDTWPQLQSRNHVMIERLGIRPDYLGVQHKHEGARHISRENASHMCRKVIAQILIDMGFEGTTEIPLDTLTQFFNCHILKLGEILKILSDNYRRQCSAIQLIKMFLQTSGYRISDLAEQIDGAKMASPQQQLQASQSQHQSPIQQTHQKTSANNFKRKHTVDLQKQQQQLERMRRVKSPTIRAAPINVEMEGRVAEVKVEAPSETSTDSNNVNSRQRNHQMQTGPQQLALMSSIQTQQGSQLRQMHSLQIPQSQIINGSGARAPLVKVDGFGELMGGLGVKHEVEERLLGGSPSSK